MAYCRTLTLSSDLETWLRDKSLHQVLLRDFGLLEEVDAAVDRADRDLRIRDEDRGLEADAKPVSTSTNIKAATRIITFFTYSEYYITVLFQILISHRPCFCDFFGPICWRGDETISAEAWDTTNDWTHK